MKRAKGIEGKLDVLWSKIIRERANHKCEVDNCQHSQKVVQAHHIFTRSNRSVRWDLNNGISLCPGHHVYSSKFSAHQTPTDFTYYLEQKYGREFLDELSRKSHSTVKLDEFDKKAMYDELKIIYDNLISKK